MTKMQRMSAVIKHAWTEPKLVAQVKWRADHPSLSMQLEGQVGRDALEHYAETGQHLNPDARASFTVYDEPDWDWWEPRHDRPWRRQHARERELDRLLA